jgi:hypothetical protein
MDDVDKSWFLVLKITSEGSATVISLEIDAFLREKLDAGAEIGLS